MIEEATKQKKQTNIDKRRLLCWDRALENFGTGYIFEQRANNYKIKLRVLTSLGILMPMIVGAIVVSFNKATLPSWLINIAGIVGLFEIVGSTWSLIARWDDSYSYSIQSLNSNFSLASRYENLARNPPKDFLIRFEILETEDQLLMREDYKQSISDKEKRRGMRAALRQYKRKCASCQIVPTSMDASNCNVCGNF